MSVTIFYPPIAIFAVVIVIIVVLLLTYGDYCCSLRVTTLPDGHEQVSKRHFWRRNIDTELKVLTRAEEGAAHAVDDVPAEPRAATGSRLASVFSR